MKYTPTLLALLGCLASSHAYYLDASCKKYESVVIDVMKGAFDLAEAGRDALSQVASTQPPSDPISKARAELFSYLFADAKPSSSDPKFMEAQAKFESVLKYNTFAGMSDDGKPDPPPVSWKLLTSNSIAIFCDYSRFREDVDCNGTPAKGAVCDTQLDFAWMTFESYYDCKKHIIPRPKSVQAWTLNSAGDKNERASAIQLCPGFLDKMQKSKTRTFKDQGPTPAVARGVKKFSTWLDDPFRKMIDTTATFDLTLLHEMTHAVRNKGTQDIDGDHSYGWRNCRRLAQHGTENADSYALFGMAAKMITQQNARAMEDGGVEVIPAPPSGPFHPPKRGLYSSLFGRADVAEDLSTSANPKPTTGKPYSTFRTSTRASSRVNGLSSSGLPGTSAVAAPTSGTSPEAASSGIPPATSNYPRPASSDTLSTTSSRPTLPDTSSSTSASSTSSSAIISATSASSDASSGIPPSTSASSGSPISASSFSSSHAAGTTTSDGASVSPSSSSSSHTTDATTTSDGTSVSTPVTAGSNTDPTSITSMPGSSGVSMITSSSSTIPIPMTVVDVTKSDTTNPVTYISTKTNVDGGEPTAAWMCTGPLCNTGCKVPIFCDSSDLGSSWGLCCGFSPSDLPDGTIPPPGGPPPPADGGEETTPDNDSTSSSSSESTSESTSSTSSTTSSTPSSTSSPTTSSTRVPSSSTTSTSDKPMLTVQPIADSFLAFDPDTPDWYEVQQSILSEAMADTVAPYITWTLSSTGPANTSPSISSTSTPLITSTTPISTSSTSTTTSSSSKPPISSSSTPAISSTTSVSAPSASTDTSSSTTDGSTSSRPPIGSSSTPPTHSSPTVTTSPTSTETSSSTTEEPPSVTPGPVTSMVDDVFGEVLYYTAHTLTHMSVYTLSLTIKGGAGDPTTLQTAMPSPTSIDNDGSSQCWHLDKDMCLEAAEKFITDAKDSDNQYELLTGRHDKYSHDNFNGLYAFQCIAVLECDKDKPGMSGLQAYKAFVDMYEQDETNVGKCGHYYLDNGCVVRTDFHFEF